VRSDQRQQLGRYGEAVAAKYLELKGWQILDRNWRCRAGELDLVAAPDPDTIVFVEVKTRRSQTCGSGAEAVTPAKLARLRRLAAAWLSQHELHAGDIRIDVVSVDATTKCSIDHFEAARL
jgi:putative endonuclease